MLLSSTRPISPQPVSTLTRMVISPSDTFFVSLTGTMGYVDFIEALRPRLLMSKFTYMGTFEVAREFLPFQEPFVRDTVAGGLADFAACIFYTPLGLIANRQMTAGYGLCSEKYGYASIRDNARTIYTQRGLQGFFVGFAPTLLTVPGSGIWWGLYGFGKRHLYAQHDTLMWLYGSTASRLPKCFTSSKENALLNGLSGSVAGALVCVVQNPLWVIKARMQIMNVPPRGALMFVVKDLMKKEGLSGFYKGMVFNATVFALECGLFSILYDLWKELATKEEAVASDVQWLGGESAKKKMPRR